MASHRQDLPMSLSFTLDLALANSPIGEDLPTPLQIGELYVALKSKPMALLYGPARSGKLDAARAIARHLAGPGSSRIQEMVGHPWWASGVQGAAVFTAAQERFNLEKIQALMVEAARDHSAGRVYVAVLSRISPAEWNDLAALALQFHRGYVRGDLDDRPRRRLLVSPRIRVIATTDALPPAPWDWLVLRQTSLLPWGVEPGPRPTPQVPGLWPAAQGRSLLEGAIQTPRSALRRLRRLTGWSDDALRPILAITRVLNLRGVHEANRAASEAMVYLANAWTRDDDGLFAPSFNDNLRLAIRFAVKVAMIPRLAGLPADRQPKAATSVAESRKSASRRVAYSD
jgi:hypothetical protein